MTGPRADFTIGQRGGDWYAFHNTPAARDAIKNKVIPLSYGDDLYAAIKAVESRFFTWEVEP